ncbi:MAG TPA: hypothetical protein IAB12_03555 [Candidatus Ornithospirochaeta avicola]|uniref:Uncharacterized protein n=1 Tax=Candidatus Ornithospirochaeta avicola TaxID=2840896 RepID=A0A9D1PUJ1_9SPIO|nr:hypothetical protein [Candidatus Ornithospirochaeta avicola]
MKIQLETIPVWDALKKDDECFICSLMKEAEEDAVNYYLSSAIMTPEVRIKTNTYGFCHHHMHLLSDGKKAQALALMMDTYYDENKRIFSPFYEKILSSGKASKIEKTASSLFSSYHEREKGCLVCQRMSERLERYLFTACSLYLEDSEFKKAFKESKGLCIHHTEKLFEAAKEVMKGDALVDFYHTLIALMRDNLDRVQKDDQWLTQKYKSENKDKSWNGCEDAANRAVDKFTSSCRILDESRIRS